MDGVGIPVMTVTTRKELFKEELPRLRKAMEHCGIKGALYWRRVEIGPEFYAYRIYIALAEGEEKKSLSDFASRPGIPRGLAERLNSFGKEDK